MPRAARVEPSPARCPGGGAVGALRWQGHVSSLPRYPFKHVYSRPPSPIKRAVVIIEMVLFTGFSLPARNWTRDTWHVDVVCFLHTWHWVTWCNNVFIIVLSQGPAWLSLYASNEGINISWSHLAQDNRIRAFKHDVLNIYRPVHSPNPEVPTVCVFDLAPYTLIMNYRIFCVLKFLTRILIFGYVDYRHKPTGLHTWLIICLSFLECRRLYNFGRNIHAYF